VNGPSGVTAWGETLSTNFAGIVVNRTSTFTTQIVWETVAGREAISYTRATFNAGSTWTAWQANDPRATAWTDLSSYLINGFSGSSTAFVGRRIGRNVEIRASLTSPAMSAGTTVQEFVSGLPQVWLPVTRNVWGAGYVSGNSVSVIVRDVGTMAVSNRWAGSITAGASLQFALNYNLD
jgi:hypothetical protein